MIETVLFDLDGTLLPMDQKEFTNEYLDRLTEKMLPYGYDPKHLAAGLWAGISAMVENNGEKSNEEVFWDDFCQIFGAQARLHGPVLDEFYASDFGLVRRVCGFDAGAKEVVDALKERGVRVVLATNPLFPAVATRQRIRWAGLEPEDFAFVTTYENSRFCKPNPAYYRELLGKLGAQAGNCLMVGNDVQEDMLPAKEIGMQTFLLTPCLIDRRGTDLTDQPRGGFPELKEFLLKNV